MTTLSAPFTVIGGLLASVPIYGRILIGIALFLLWVYVYNWPYTEYTLSYRNVPGPPRSSFLWGSLLDVLQSKPGERHTQWTAEYGPTHRFHSVFGTIRLYTADPGGLSFILQHSDDFIKPERSNRTLKEMIGDGILTAEGADHRRQRKIMNPAFGPAALRDMLPIMWEKTYELKAKLFSLIEDPSNEEASPTPPVAMDIVPGARKVDMLKYIAMTALDIIGSAGFGYEFNSIGQGHNPLATAFSRMFSLGQQIKPLRVLQIMFPVLKVIPTESSRIIKECYDLCCGIGRDIVHRKRRQIQAEYSGDIEKKTDMGKDLLSILMKANMAPDLRPDQKMSDDEVLAQITTFMLAGNETTSTALTWAVYRLSQHPDIQKRLRAECSAVDSDQPGIDELNALPYLDKVTHEVLRYDGPVPSTERMAARDMVIPLTIPIIGRDGTTMTSINAKKGCDIAIPIMSVNRSKSVWGPDADQFNPDRFDVGGFPKEPIPGVYGSLMTFLGGPRNCIGYRFALAEFKAILFMLARSFEIETLPSKPVIEHKANIVIRPRVFGEEEAGLQMPLLLRLVE